MTEENKKEKKPLFIPKQSGLGWTLNFENKWSYVIVAILLLALFGNYYYHHFYQK